MAERVFDLFAFGDIAESDGKLTSLRAEGGYFKVFLQAGVIRSKCSGTPVDATFSVVLAPDFIRVGQDLTEGPTNHLIPVQACQSFKLMVDAEKAVIDGLPCSS